MWHELRENDKQQLFDWRAVDTGAESETVLKSASPEIDLCLSLRVLLLSFIALNGQIHETRRDLVMQLELDDDAINKCERL